MPSMQRLKSQGVWFENFFANSFRTDRGEVAILSGFPAQTLASIMKLPAKNRSLPSVARSLAREGYDTRFVYGGDLNFTNQSPASSTGSAAASSSGATGPGRPDGLSWPGSSP